MHLTKNKYQNIQYLTIQQKKCPALDHETTQSILYRAKRKKKALCTSPINKAKRCVQDQKANKKRQFFATVQFLGTGSSLQW